MQAIINGLEKAPEEWSIKKKALENGGGNKKAHLKEKTGEF